MKYQTYFLRKIIKKKKKKIKILSAAVVIRAIRDKREREIDGKKL